MKESNKRRIKQILGNMTKEYMKPATQVVEIHQRSGILSGSVNGVDGNASLRYGGGGSGPARARSFDGCDDSWNEEYEN
jgi:hypothetical protein